MEFDAPAVLGWLLIGTLAGWLTGRIMQGGRFGPIGHMVTGVIGAAAGGYLLPHYDYLPDTLPGELIGGAIGAVILLLVVSLFARE